MDVEQKTLSGERQKLAELLAQLEGDQPVSGKELHAMWDGRARPFWRVQPRIYRALAEKCRRAGENFLAIEVADEGIAWFDQTHYPAEYKRLTHIRALAYAKAGSRDQAREMFGTPELGTHDSVAGLSLLAGTRQDWFDIAGDDAFRRRQLAETLTVYRQKLVSDPRALLAASAAATSLLLDALTPGDAAPPRPETAALAREARRLCIREHSRTHYEDEARAAFERLAIVATSGLILGEFHEARELFRQAGQMGSDSRADLFITRKQVRLLLAAHGREPSEFDPCFPLPNVALFAGHLFDLPGRQGVSRLPEERAAAVAGRIAQTLREHNILIGYGSAAGGADLLFLSEVLARPGGEIHLVLPFARERFRHENVLRGQSRSRWGEEFDRILAAATSITELGDSPCWFEENAIAFSNRVLHGMAERRAREFSVELHTVAVWDGQPTGERAGGTADCVRQWRARGHRRVIIPPDGNEPSVEDHQETALATAALPVSEEVASHESGFAFRVHEEIRAILSGEWDLPPEAARQGERSWLTGVGLFYARAAEHLEPFAGRILHRWVDGARFRLVFDDLDQAGRAALALRDRGASGGRLRLGLHAGPVMRWPHPFLLTREEPAGIHLQKASRLAAIPWTAEVRASREYVALLETAPPPPDRKRLRCVYQGIVPLGEPFDRQELFVVTA